MAQKINLCTDVVDGDVDDGYGKVADAFRRNLSSGQEIGAAVAVYRDGRKGRRAGVLQGGRLLVVAAPR